MKKAPVWLLRETVLAMHDLLIADFGGAAGVRDEGLLDSALMRPQHLFAYEPSSSLFDLALRWPLVSSRIILSWMATSE